MNNNYELLHTMIRVYNLESSVDFYTRLMGMKLLRRKDFAEGRFTLAFLGYAPEKESTVIELTYNWDQEERYEMGNAFGHLAIGVKDIYGVCKSLEEEGVPVPRPAGPMKGGERIIAFVEDPDGYKIELIEH